MINILLSFPKQKKKLNTIQKTHKVRKKKKLQRPPTIE